MQTFLHFCLGTFHQLWKDVAKQKTRTFFAIAGMTWGIYAFVMLLAIGQGLYAASQTNIDKLSRPMFYISLRPSTESDNGMGPGIRPWFSLEDQQNLKKEFPDIELISSSISKLQNVTYQNQDTWMEISGKMPQALLVENFELAPGGRFISPLDNLNHRHVVVLNDFRKQELFQDSDPLGKIMHIGGIGFTVIGVLANKGFNMGGGALLIPYNTAEDLFQDKHPQAAVLLKPGVNVQNFIARAEEYLAQRYHLSYEDKHIFNTFSLTQFLDDYVALLWGLEIFLNFCGLMMLIVGAIGVSNMMYLSLKERTPEIGLKMALGAKQSQIMIQFLLETIVLVFLSGVIAFFLAFLTIKLLSFIPFHGIMNAPHLSGWGLMFAWLILAIVAFVAGFSPAKRAAKLSPTLALRSK
jgi:putative ABC transport system permease protein